MHLVARENQSHGERSTFSRDYDGMHFLFPQAISDSRDNQSSFEGSLTAFLSVAFLDSGN
jgi:hypothetical protein